MKIRVQALAHFNNYEHDLYYDVEDTDEVRQYIAGDLFRFVPFPAKPGKNDEVTGTVATRIQPGREEPRGRRLHDER